jgi:hypothetical protein
MAHPDVNPDYTEKRSPADTDEATLAKIKAEYEKNGWRLDNTLHSPGRYAPEELVLCFRRIVPSLPLE